MSRCIIITSGNIHVKPVFFTIFVKEGINTAKFKY